MQVTILYMAQLKQAAGTAAEQVQLDAPCSVLDLVRRVAHQHGDPLRRLLLDGSGAIQPTNLFFVGDEQVPATALLTDGQVVTILSPIAGG
jgi:molybdopterin converting factor small subunit